MSGISLDEIVFATGAGAVDSNTLRVELSTESLAALENITVTIDNVDLDFRDLAFATDKVDVSGSEVSLDAATLSALENITVSATDLDIRDLVFATDKVDVSGSTVNAAVAPLVLIKSTVSSVTTTAAEVVATPLEDRKEITIQNEGSQDVYIGSTALLAVPGSGIKISKNSSATYQWGPDVDIFMSASAGTQSVRFLEAA